MLVRPGRARDQETAGEERVARERRPDVRDERAPQASGAAGLGARSQQHELHAQRSEERAAETDVQIDDGGIGGRIAKRSDKKRYGGRDAPGEHDDQHGHREPEPPGAIVVRRPPGVSPARLLSGATHAHLRRTHPRTRPPAKTAQLWRRTNAVASDSTNGRLGSTASPAASQRKQMWRRLSSPRRCDPGVLGEVCLCITLVYVILIPASSDAGFRRQAIGARARSRAAARDGSCSSRSATVSTASLIASSSRSSGSSEIAASLSSSRRRSPPGGVGASTKLPAGRRDATAPPGVPRLPLR